MHAEERQIIAVLINHCRGANAFPIGLDVENRAYIQPVFQIARNNMPIIMRPLPPTASVVVAVVKIKDMENPSVRECHNVPTFAKDGL